MVSRYLCCNAYCIVKAKIFSSIEKRSLGTPDVTLTYDEQSSTEAYINMENSEPVGGYQFKYNADVCSNVAYSSTAPWSGSIFTNSCGSPSYDSNSRRHIWDMFRI